MFFGRFHSQIQLQQLDHDGWTSQVWHLTLGNLLVFTRIHKLCGVMRINLAAIAFNFAVLGR